MDYNKTFYELSEEEYDDMNIAEWYDTYKKYKKLEEEIGCPPEVRCKLYNGMIVYGKRKKWQIDSIDREVLVCYKPHCKFTEQAKYFKISDHKKTWWLKEDKTE